MRIVCLLPSATDICIALGLSDYIVGITHECNLAALLQSRSKKNTNIHVVTKSGLDPENAKSQADIDAQVKEVSSLSSTCPVGITASTVTSIESQSLYPILEYEFQIANPTIVFTQNLCAVCAPTPDVVNAILSKQRKAIGSITTSQDRTEQHPEHQEDGKNQLVSKDEHHVEICSLDPHSLADVAETFLKISHICKVPERGQQLKDEFMMKLELINETITDKLQPEKSSCSSSTTRKRILFLEWLDPPYDAGHWIPEMIGTVGCMNTKFEISQESINSKSKHKSKQISWEKIYESDPDIILIASCGFDLHRNVQDALRYTSKLVKLRAAQNNNIFACNGDLNFTRPGPFLIDGVMTIAECVFSDGNHQDILDALNRLHFASTIKTEWQRVPIYEAESKKDNKNKILSSDDVFDIEDSFKLMSKDFVTAHDEACRNGQTHYEDPETGYQVMTELAHKKRGKCCGSGCRHYPYNHENVRDKASRIKQPAFLFEGSGNVTDSNCSSQGGKNVHILFFSGGKDSFLTIRALIKSFKLQQSEKNNLIFLLTTFDATSRIVPHQNIHIDTIVKQAKHLMIPLVGVPMHRSSNEKYVARIDRAMDLIANHLGEKRNNLNSTLVFGDLHLEHIRSWREKELSNLGSQLLFPLWKSKYDDLMNDFEESGIHCAVSESTTDIVKHGEIFNRSLYNKLENLDNIDSFGENGEFHSVAKVWKVSRKQALGL
mmetsp:Transcript_27303/g.33759  ORF Transcript_27303/g.33759 Transcript_27303/m.33759 type:complete len:720 (+) Transcript_27303:20-2179(+)